MAEINISDGGETLTIDSVTVANTLGSEMKLGLPTDGSYADGKLPLTADTTIADAIDAINEDLLTLPTEDRVGWIRIVDITVAGGDTVTSKVWEDAAQTILQSCTTSTATMNVLVQSGFPTVDVDGNAATLPKVGDIYSGAVPIVLAATGDVVAEATDPDGNPAAQDTVAVTLDLPPNLTALSFTGGYPGSQTELKAGDTFDVAWTADKLTDALEVQDFGASDAVQLLTFGAALSGTVTVTIGDRGTTPQLLSLQAKARDSVSAALGPSRDTNLGGGGVDGTDVVNLNNLYPTVNIGAATYPASQGALKGAESATVVNTASDYDSITYDDNTSGELTPTSPSTFQNPKTVTRAGGSYNVSVPNFRIQANRAANDATTTDTDVVAIANVAATVTVSEATARVRSGPAPGNDTTISIASDQQLFAAPSLDPAVGRGTFQGSWAGGPSTWTRDLRVPDSENPATGASHTWINLVATNLAGIVTSSITGDALYVIGGLTARTVNYAAFTANSTETFPLTTEAKLTAGAFSNGNPAVVQPFGTADTTDAGKEGWCAPTASSGTAVNMRMLHSPTVAANSSGLTLTLLEETV